MGALMGLHLVTGGAGFIGSNLVASLQERGEEVAVCDVLGHQDKWKNLGKRELKDLFPPAALPEWLQRNADSLKSILHMGAISATTETDVDKIIENNFELSKRLFGFCTEREVPLVYASSAATYGDGTQGFMDDESPEALARLRPLNPYGWSKHLFDRWVARRVAEGLPLPPQWAGLKFFNVYGPNEYHKGSMKSVVCKVFHEVRTDGVARLFKSYNPEYPDGGQKRDFVWVGDCVEVCLWLLEHPGVSGLFNLGSGEARTFVEFVRPVFEALGVEERIDFIEMPEGLRGRYQYFTKAEMGKLKGVGYGKGMTPVEVGVREYVEGFLSAGDAYR
ncbi:MAG TPA: ADP-glyceromanno-heptose 6-epimerase [Planctomycetes bacterium]|nr:ADP-glyceromanno-heptose 6-epimerase [Planctomycetota bacterium]